MRARGLAARAGVGIAVALLEVSDLAVTFTRRGRRDVKAVDGVSFAVDAGETLGLVGESGSGKSVTSLAIMGLLPPKGVRIGGSVEFAGRSLLTMRQDDLRDVRGREIAMIFQAPLSALNPVVPIGTQVTEVLVRHRKLSGADARREAARLLDLVGIPDPDRRLKEYAYQLSGGMRQRALIAMAVACEPKLLIADEPTTALDVTIQAQILDLLVRLQRERGMGLVLITHDMGVVAETAHRVIVQYAGQQIEQQDTLGLFRDPHHPYTAALLAALPERSTERLLPSIPGVVPGAYDRPAGCLLAPRCAYAAERCIRERPALTGDAARAVRCHFPL